MRTTILAAAVLIGSLAITPLAEAKKGGGGNWKGPPPHGNAWGHYKNGWPGYAGWYGGYPMYGPPPAYYGWPPPPAPTAWRGLSAGAVAPPIVPEPLPPPPLPIP